MKFMIRLQQQQKKKPDVWCLLKSQDWMNNDGYMQITDQFHVDIINYIHVYI